MASALQPQPQGSQSLPQLLNIAGEIIHLQGVQGNSGRTAERQFHTNFTNNDSEIEILKKVFGVPTLRHTPKILTKEGCSLTKEEATVVKRILTSRVASLRRGIQMSSGLAMHATHQKIRNYEILLKRLQELTGSSLDACEPPPLRSIQMRLPSSLPFSFSQKDSSIKELLLLVLMLLTGFAKGTLRSENIRQRLGSTTLQEIATKLHTKQVTMKNVQQYVSTSLQLPAPFRGFITEHAIVSEETQECNEERTRLTAEIRGKDDALRTLKALLEQEQYKAVNLAGRIASNTDTTQIEALRSVKEVKEELAMRIKGLEEERVQANDTLQTLLTKCADVDRVRATLVKSFEDTKDKVRKEYEERILTLTSTIRQKEDIQEQRSGIDDPQEHEKTQKEIQQLKETLADLKHQEEQMISQVLIAVDTLNTQTPPIEEAAYTSQESMQARLRVLEAILEKHPDRVDIQQMVSRLQASLVPEDHSGKERGKERSNDKGRSSSGFADDLKKLLLQTALLDSDIDVSNTPDTILEPVKETLCLLLIFVELFYKELNHRVGEAIVDYKRTHSTLVPETLRYVEAIPKLVNTIDHILLGDIEDTKLWETITTIGKLIDGLLYTGLLPDAPTLYSKLHEFDKKGGLLQSLLKKAIHYLPESTKIIQKVEDGSYKIVEKHTNDTSYSELPILFLLQMKLLSRYTEYILNKAPNTLECPALGLAIDQS